VNRDDAFNTHGRIWKENGFFDSQQLLAKIQFNGFKGIVMWEDPRKIAPQPWFITAAQAAHIDSFSTIDEGHGYGDSQKGFALRLEYKLPIKAFDLTLYHNFYEKTWSNQPVFSGGNNNRFFGFNGEALLLDNKLDLNFGGDLYGLTMQRGDYPSQWAGDSLGISWSYNGWETGQLYEQTSNFFAQARYTMTDKFSALLGGRVDYFHRYGPGMRFVQSMFNKNDSTKTDTLVGSDYAKALINGPRAGLFYHITPAILVKYLFNRTFRTPGGNETRSTPNIKPETNIENELSISINTGGNLFADAVVYDQRVGNEIVRDPNTFNTFTNGGQIVSDGFELSLKWLPVQDLLIYTNGSVCASKTTNTVFQKDPTDTLMFIPVDTAFATRFQPLYSGIIGVEYDVVKQVKIALDGRINAGIPYLSLAGVDKKALVAFLDASLTSRRFLKNHLELSAVFLNILDNKYGVRSGAPAFGEHAQNANGTISPEGFKMYGKVNLYF
jgi:outer membrane receptor protein involved in Fe transport